MDKENEIKAHITKYYGFEVISVKKTENGVINTNYICDTLDGSFVLKIFNYRTPTELQFEIEVLEKLEEFKFESARIQKTIIGKAYEMFDAKPTIIYHKIAGTSIDTISDSLIENIGKTMGSMHKILEGFRPSVMKKTWDPVELSSLVKQHGDELLTRKFKDARTLLNFVYQELPKYTFPSTLLIGVTHQDMKPENIHVDGDTIQGVFDFDNSYVGALIHDITTSLIWIAITNYHIDEKKVKLFLKGYEQYRPMTPSEKSIFNDALQWRLVREVFIGMYVTPDFPEVVEERAQYFMQIYKNFALINI